MRIRYWCQHGRFLLCTILLSLGVVTGVTAGTVSGTITNAGPGQKLPLYKGNQILLTITVPPAGQRYSIVLDPGGYSAHCPNGSIVKIQALNGAVIQNISC